MTAGNALVIMVIETSGQTRSFTCTSDIDGSFGSPVVDYDPARGVTVWVLHGASAGNHTITIGVNASTGFQVYGWEWPDLDLLATPVVGTFLAGGNATTQYAAAVGEIDTAGACAIVVGGVLNAGGGTISPSGSYTQVTAAALPNQVLVQYWDAPSAVTDERGIWTHTPTARIGTSAMVAFPYVSGGADPAEGSASLGLSLGASATGAHVARGTASPALSLDVAAQGAHVAGGTGTLALSLGAAASGAHLAAGSAAPGLALDLAAAGDAPSVDEASGSASAGLSLGATAAGAHVASGHASADVALDVSAVGQLRAAGQAVVALALDLAATGDAPSVGEAEGSAALGLSLGAAATGAHVAAGHAAPGIVLDLAALGARVSAGDAAAALALDVVAVGQANVPVVPDVIVIGTITQRRVTVGTITQRRITVGTITQRGQ